MTAMYCERCVWGTGEHAEFCEAPFVNLLRNAAAKIKEAKPLVTLADFRSSAVSHAWTIH